MVSVIICTYNYGRFIGEAIQSVLSQTEGRFELIVIDNGSTDQTEAVVRSFNDARIRYQRQAQTGVAEGRNRGVELSTGKYICFLDADDLIGRDKLRRSVEFLEANPEIALVYSDMRYFRDGEPDKHYYTYACDAAATPWMAYVSGSGTKVVRRQLQGNTMVINSPVVRRSVFNSVFGFDTTLDVNEDWDLWLRIMLGGHHISYLEAPDTMALVRVHTKSLSRDVFRMQVEGLRVLLHNAAAIRKLGLDDVLELRIRAHRASLVNTLFASRGALFAERCRYLYEKKSEGGLAAAPWSIKKWIVGWRMKKAL